MMFHPTRKYQTKLKDLYLQLLKIRSEMHNKFILEGFCSVLIQCIGDSNEQDRLVSSSMTVIFLFSCSSLVGFYSSLPISVKVAIGIHVMLPKFLQLHIRCIK